LDAVKAVADGIKQAMEEARKSAVPVVVAPTDPRAALAAEAIKVNENYDALCADGKYAEAQAMRDSFMAKANQATQGDPSANPLVKTAVGLGKKAAKIDHGPIMAKYGDEIERYVNSLPVEERIQPDAWDRAVSNVKSTHFDDILKESTEAAVKAATSDFVAAGAQPGSRGRKSGTAPGLDELQLMACEMTGISPEAYSKRLKAEEEYDKIPARQRGAFEGYPTVSDEVKPGRF
jgi:hypothetical protein